MAKIFRKNILKNPPLEVDEIFFDVQALKSNDSKFEKSIWEKIFFLFFSLALCLILVLLFRTAQLSLFKNNIYASLADYNYKRFQYDLAPRGIIYDRSGEQLVFNVPSLDLVLISNQFPFDLQEQEIIFEELSKITDFEKPKNIPFSAEPILLKENLDIEKAIILENKSDFFRGVKVEKNVRRHYKDGPIFSHLIGYTGKPTAVDTIGKDGLEAFYDEILQGQNSKRELEVDALGNLRNDFLVSELENGKDLHLTIDAELQRRLYKILKKHLVGQGGAAVALDPRNGEILALVSLPSFDNNLLVLKDAGLKDLFIDPLHPFFNRVISGEYPSGSTIKPFIGLAALEEKLINEKTQIFDPGAIYIRNQYHPNIIYTYSSYAPLGLLDIKQALAFSSNVFFYILGGGLPDQVLNFSPLGIERINKYLRLFGLGSKTGIDLAGEAGGLIPLPLWKETVKKEQWLLGDTYNVSVGQGDLTVTPLQLDLAFSVIINGGTIFKPHLLKNQPAHILRTNFLDKKNLDVIRAGLRDSVRYGTSKNLNTLPVAAGGKTGTAQRGDNPNDNYAWSLSFAPFENPEIALVVLIEGGKGGATNAVPVAKEVLEWYFSK